MTCLFSSSIVNVDSTIVFISGCLLHRCVLRWRALGLQCKQVGIESVVVVVPEVPERIGPFGNLLHGSRLQPAGTPLRLPTPRDQTSLFQHLEVFGNGRQGHREGSRQLVYRSLSAREAGKDLAPGWIGQSREDW